MIIKMNSGKFQRSSIIVFIGIFLVATISVSACSTRNLGKISPADLPEIKSLSIKYIGNKTRIVIEGERIIFYKAYKKPALSQLIIEIPGFVLNKTIKPMLFENGAISGIIPREIKRGEPTVQIEIGLLPLAASNILLEGRKMIVEITPASILKKEKIPLSGEKVKNVSLQPKLQQPDMEKFFLHTAIREKTQAFHPDFLIGPEDILEIMVWKNDVLSRTVTVRPDGKISFPLLGDVRVVGLNPNQLREKVTILLKEYMENPVVTVIVQEINSYVVYLMGEVANPGKYQLKSNLTLLQTIALAGGFTQFASRNKIVILRRDNGQSAETKIKVRYDDIVFGGKSENIILKPGDTIIVP